MRTGHHRLAMNTLPPSRRVPQGGRILPLGHGGREHDRGGDAGAMDGGRVYEMFPRLKERRGNFGNELSGGEQQMLAVGRALTFNPKVLLLDEPTEGLAPIIVEELLRALGTITRAGGMCSIIVEQNARKILGLADRAVILERGASCTTRQAPRTQGRHLHPGAILGVAGESWQHAYCRHGQARKSRPSGVACRRYWILRRLRPRNDEPKMIVIAERRVPQGE